jgi:hypothetical protein
MTTFNWGEEDEVKCPICGFNYVHFESNPFFIKGEDNYKAWIGRGDAVKIPVYCENEHHWNIVLGFHKGQMYFTHEIPEKRKEYVSNE